MEAKKWGSDGGFSFQKRREELDAVLDSWQLALEENDKFIQSLKKEVT